MTRSERLWFLLALVAAGVGHCKIFSFNHGTAVRDEDRRAEKADPLYAGAPAAAAQGKE